LYELVESPPDGFCIAADMAFHGNIVGAKIVNILKEGQIIPEELLAARPSSSLGRKRDNIQTTRRVDQSRFC
jgi:hypothetical protein